MRIFLFDVTHLSFFNMIGCDQLDRTKQPRAVWLKYLSSKVSCLAITKRSSDS
jgi:hypothetical protein